MTTKPKKKIQLNWFDKAINFIMDANHGLQIVTLMPLGKSRIGIDCKSGASPIDYLSSYGIQTYGLLTYRMVLKGEKRNLQAFYVSNGQRRYALTMLKKCPSDFGIAAATGGKKTTVASALERAAKFAGVK